MQQHQHTPEKQMSMQQLLSFVESLCDKLYDEFAKNAVDTQILAAKKSLKAYNNKMDAIHHERNAKAWQAALGLVGSAASAGLMGTAGINKIMGKGLGLTAEVATHTGHISQSVLSGVGNIPELVISNESKEEYAMADGLQSAVNGFDKNASSQNMLAEKMLERQIHASQAFVDAGQQLINALRA